MKMVPGSFCRLLFAVAAFVIPFCTPQIIPSTAICKPETFSSKTRVFILSDISNEPDDQESLVRTLLYSNQVSLLGLGATTSFWQRNKTDPDAMHTVVSAYAEVLANLQEHADGYPSAEYLHSIISSGADVYGTAALEANATLSAAAKALVKAVDGSEEPTWVLLWGGSNTLAQAVFAVAESRDGDAAAAFLAKLRIYAISDQDDTGALLRERFPQIFYIVSIHAFSDYASATWTGISGEKYYKNEYGGGNSSVVSADWLKDHIQLGPLGSAYPDLKYIMEGDTPSFLYLVRNGLGVPEQPSWGSWGGRYAKVSTLDGRNTFSDTSDSVVGADNATHRNSFATIWRWRNEFQADFAARMQWSLASTYADANHAPVAVVNSTCGPEPLLFSLAAEESLVLDAGESYDPDGDHVIFKWWQYSDPTLVWDEVAELGIEADGASVRVTMPSREDGCNELAGCLAFHLILEVRDQALVSYRRVVLQLVDE